MKNKNGQLTKGERMNSVYSNLGSIKTGYKEQLIYYYNLGVGKISEIAGVLITKDLISIIEKRYGQLGGRLPIPAEDILAKRGLKWKELKD
tara:strand:- start:463 stop:735 length:273 start_codon:yes stop_codon:yes gene_type:complete